MEGKIHQIGIQLGVPHSKMEMFKKGEDVLSTVVNFWLNGNVPDVPVCWESIVAALESTHVGEIGLAMALRAKYCGQQDEVQDDSSECHEYIHIYSILFKMSSHIQSVLTHDITLMGLAQRLDMTKRAVVHFRRFILSGIASTEVEWAGRMYLQ